MNVHVTAAGRTCAVAVRRDGGRFLVSVDGRQHEVDVKVINGVWSLLVGRVEGPAKAGPSDQLSVGAGFPGSPKLGTSEGGSRPTRSYEIAFSGRVDVAMTVHVDGMPVEVSITQMRRPGGSASSHSAGEGPQRVTAPMPGKIVKVLVKPGDKVEARQGLIVVEAMKMENELRSRASGTVSEVRVTEGSSVEAGAILVVLE